MGHLVAERNGAWELGWEAMMCELRGEETREEGRG